MVIKKKPYEFWNYRDTRKEKFPELKSPVLPVIHTDTPKVVKGLISHHILLPIAELTQPLFNRLRADLTFRNPEFDAAKKYGKGFVSYAIPEFVRFYSIDSKYLGLPRSVKLTYLYKKFTESGLKLELEDIRPKFETINFVQKTDVKPFFYQNEAIDRIKNGNVIIRLRCGRGKTILALLAVASIRLRTLILVRTNILMKQWIESIHKVFDISNDDIGIIQGYKRKHGLITVAMEETLVNMSRKEKQEIGAMYGHLTVDEAHETGSALYRELMTYFKSRFTTGLSATPFREDGMDPVLKLYIGPIVEIDDLGEFETELHLRRTAFTYHFDGKKSKYHELISSLIKDKDRNQLIITDVNRYVLEGKMVVIYSNRIEHMEILEQMIKKQMPGIKTDILASRKYGNTMTVEDHELIRAAMKSHELQAVAGGKIIEQGFDCPPLGVAILATPTKSKRLIEQVLGRCQREFPGKKMAVLVDYIDEKTKILLYQFFNKNKKLYKTYKKVYND